MFHIVTCIPIARQRLGKDIPARANARKNMTSIARQRISKHASLTIEAAVQSGYTEVFSIVDSEESSFGTSAIRDMISDLNWVGRCRIKARQELGGYNETLISPLPGYD
jgi:hypothetical protein